MVQVGAQGVRVALALGDAADGGGQAGPAVRLQFGQGLVQGL